jgi:hypothetical protein
MKQLVFRLLLIVIFLIVSRGSLSAQAKLVINIQNGASLVIDNPVNTAIIRNGTGYIKSEGAGNGDTYLIPFGNAVFTQSGKWLCQFMVLLITFYVLAGLKIIQKYYTLPSATSKIIKLQAT